MDAVAEDLLFAHSQACIVQIDDAAEGLAICMWILFYNYVKLKWIIPNVTVMPEEKFLVWQTFSNVSKFSDTIRKIPGVTNI